MTHHTGNPLEAGVAVIELDVTCISHITDQVGGHDGLDEIVTLGQITDLLMSLDRIVGIEEAGLVAGEEDILALIILTPHSETIRIGI